MENDDKHDISEAPKHQTNTYSPPSSFYNHHHRDRKPPSPSARSPEDSPAKSSVSSDQSSLSHGFSPREESVPGSPPAELPEHAPATVVNQLAVTITDPPVEDGVFRRTVEEGGGSGGKKVRPSLLIMRRAKKEKEVKKVALGFRIFGLLFCLISLSVMAADNNKGWALDSFHRYKEFRYCMSVNAIGFVYSGVQALDLAYQLATGKYVIRHQLRYYFDFAIDQMLSYLLMSASSSAAVRVDDWKSNWGKDKFPDMASASVGMSFLAFVAFVFSSLISGYTLCTFKAT